MLQELVIHDFAIIQALELSFERGMTTLTGETGAGKSIIIDAVGLLAGGRGSADFVRTGSQKATLEGLFDAASNPRTKQVLAKYGLEGDDGMALLQRDIYASGRNICRINGRLVNTATLREVGETLVDIHGQNEHQQLMHPETHLGLLDQFAGGKVQKLLTAYQDLYQQLQTTSAALRKKQQNEQEWAQRLDMLHFQVKEIQAANLKPDEEDQLQAERDRLANYQKISDALTQSYEILTNDEGNPQDQIGQAMANMQGIAKLDPAFSDIASALETVFYSLQDTVGDLSKQTDALEFDEGRLDDVEKRLDLIAQLKRKYGDSVPAIIAYGQKAAQELAGMQSTEAGEEDLEQTVAKQMNQLLDLGEQLRAARKEAAEKLIHAIHEQLAQLYMDKTVFSVHFRALKRNQLRPDGIDEVEFYIQTNPGESAKPLAKIASGGELSRIMLAVKTILAKTDGVTSIIFDEVDTGVSGRVAQAIANKISLIARHSQVLCITHLPQVAAMSDHEFVIEKHIAKGRTKTSVKLLDEKSRVQEIARMSAGTTITHLAVQHAQELLDMAEATKKKLKD